MCFVGPLQEDRIGTNLAAAKSCILENEMIAANEVLTIALGLPTDQRAELAQRLFESLPPEYEWPIVVDEELEREIFRRIEDHRLGKSKTIDLETFARTLREVADGSSE
jgi:putative addiction module component (TIGR02574 family)